MSTTDKLVFNLLDQHDMLGPIAREAADAIERLIRERDQERHARQLHSAEIARLTIERDEARLRGDVHQGPMQGFAAIDPATANVDWRARATNLAADVERLTRERDEAQRENMDMVWQRRSAEFRAEAAEARIAKLEAALRSVEVEAVDLERRCSKLGHDRFSDHADAIAVIARAALKEPS